MDIKRPCILKSEVVTAIKDMKWKKDMVDDSTPAELLKELGRQGVAKLTKPLNKICLIGEWPTGFLDVIVIALEETTGEVVQRLGTR